MTLVDAANTVHDTRPCWWWASLLPPDVEDICIPDTVFSAPTQVPSRGSNTAAPEAAVAPDQTSRRQTASASQHRAKGLLWAFSRAEVIVSDEVNGANDPRTKSRGGLLAVEDKGSGGGAIPPSPLVETRGRGAKIGLSTQRRPLQQRPPVQHRLHTRVIDGKDDLLCAARAICECGRRGGGGGGGWKRGEGSVDGSDGTRKREGSKLKLPLALLKIWGYESDEERGRKSHGGNCRGRRLTVVSRSLSLIADASVSLHATSSGHLCILRFPIKGCAFRRISSDWFMISGKTNPASDAVSISGLSPLSSLVHAGILYLTATK